MQDPIGPLEVIATNSLYCDPAIDVPRDDDGHYVFGDNDEADRMIAEYRRTRDRSVLKFKDGAQPTIFLLKPLPAQYVRVNLGSVPEQVRSWYSFRAACDEVRMPNGGRIDTQLRKSVKKTDMALVPDEKMEEFVRRFGLDTIDEIGQVALDRARLPEGARGPFSYRVG